MVVVRVTEAEKVRLVARADDAGVKFSEWVRARFGLATKGPKQ